MTPVNWERLPGETVEEFVAAMLLLRNPHGNRITPSRGDRGVDIRIAGPDGFDIYQVKRFCRPLTARQVADVEESWRRFVAETLPVLPVRSWTLVMPWNPTHERLEWLERLTAGSGLRIAWMDRGPGHIRPEIPAKPPSAGLDLGVPTVSDLGRA
ncbi:hypothetical protein [Nonomuraea sp. NPDC049400]|uniref:hypothetical protein n=1 Tax=Nonomuraea sp. NPDC049400 TaxID=3364352 RepID=UPI0037A432DF